MIMLTPAEELGLSGHHIDSRVRRAAARLAPAQLRELAQRVTQAAGQHRLLYVRDGLLEVVRILLCPLVLLPDQQAYLNHVSLTLLGALKRLPDLYLSDPAVRAILPFSGEEQTWLRDSWTQSHRDHNPVFGRLDAVVQFTTPHWKESLHFLEPNLNGVGGIHYAPAVNDIISEIVMPALRAVDPQLVLLPGVDERGLFMQAVLGHLTALGRAGRRLCLVEPVDADSGPDEQAAMVEYYKRVYELDILHADPRELSLVGDEVYCRGVLIDLAYRDYSIRDLAELERTTGKPLLAMRALFRQNRIISSVAGEFDHKSCWELLTDDELARRHFSAEERQAFARHVLWTRLLRDCRTSLPDGSQGELSEYVRTQRESLVLKPNCDYGGHGVTLGPACTQAEWESVLEQALRTPAEWVVQRLSNLPVHEFPVVAADGAVSFEPFYVVMGLAPTEDGLGILCRASQKQVVNVAQRGGLVAVLLAGEVPPLHSLAPPPAAGLLPPRVTPAAALWQELQRRLAELNDLDSALGVLGWDEETYAPEGARPTRGRQTATLESLRQRLLSEPALGDLLASLTAIARVDSDEAVLLARLSHRRAMALRIPDALVRALATARSLATAAWEHARRDGDYKSLGGPLGEVLRLTRERAAALSTDLPPYDALLDEYETGLRAAPLLTLLRELIAQLTPLRQAIAERPQPDDSFLCRLPFAEAEQWQLQLLLVRDLGFDQARGRLDRSSHPFTLACSEHDTRLTTSLSEREPLRGLYSTLHELGHGLYDQGFAPEHYQTGLAEAPSMSVHESQARLWENHVGRSRGFYARYQPVLAALFPGQLAGVTAEQLYRAACLVRPGLSRITADELTYDVHVLWRCELEAALLAGELAVADLPGAWAELVHRYLGLAVTDPRLGFLQDVHWPQGMFGFFPMYSLGNIYAAALMAAFARSNAPGEAARQDGWYGPLLVWLRQRIHRRGHLLDAPALIAEATGQPVSAAPLVDYLTRKYRELYGLA